MGDGTDTVEMEVRGKDGRSHEKLTELWCLDRCLWEELRPNHMLPSPLFSDQGEAPGVE